MPRLVPIFGVTAVALAPLIARGAQPTAPLAATPTPAAATLTPAATSAPSSSPPPTPAPTSSRKPGLIQRLRGLTQRGATFVSVGLAVAPDSRTQFDRTSSPVSSTSFEAWNVGTTRVLHTVEIVGTNDYRTFLYSHVQREAGAACPAAREPGCVGVVGPAGGSTNVAAFNVREAEYESLNGIAVGGNVYVAIGNLTRYNDYGYSRLYGFGYAVGLRPSIHEPVSPYVTFAYYPNVGGNVATPGGTQGISYRGLHYRGGLIVELGKSHVFLDGGTIGTRFHPRVNAPGTIDQTGGYTGFGFRF